MLSSEQLACFAADGFIVVPGVVPEHLLAAADDEIDRVVRRDPPPKLVATTSTFRHPPNCRQPKTPCVAPTRWASQRNSYDPTASITDLTTSR